MRIRRHINLPRAIALVGLFAAFSCVQAETLSQAIKYAIKTNPAIQERVAKRFAVGEELNQAKAAFLPTLELTAGYGRERSLNPTSRSITGAAGSITLNRREAEAVLTQNLFTGFRNISEVERQRAHMHSEAFHLLADAEDLGLDATKSFLNVIRDQKLQQLEQINVEEHERMLSMIRERSESGLSRKADVSQAESRVALAHANLVSARSAVRDSTTNYIKVIGHLPGRLKWPKSPSKSKLFPRTLKRSLHVAHMKNPSLKAITADVLANEAELRSAKSFKFPQVDLVLSASRNNNLDGLRGPNQDNIAVVRARYTAFKGGAILAKEREIAYRVQQAEETRNRNVLLIDEHVRLSWNQMKELANRLVYIREHIIAAEETLAAYKEQFKLNKRTLLDVLDAHNEMISAKKDLITATHDEMLARYRLLNGIGRLLKFVKVRAPVETFVPEPHAFTFL